jgi:hypothetical protein
MKRGTFRKYAKEWCQLHGQSMPRRGRQPGKRRLTYMACLPGTVTQQEFENRRVPANERLGFNFPPPPSLSTLPELDARQPAELEAWKRFFEKEASSEPSVKTATDVA